MFSSRDFVLSSTPCHWGATKNSLVYPEPGTKQFYSTKPHVNHLNLNNSPACYITQGHILKDLDFFFFFPIKWKNLGFPAFRSSGWHRVFAVPADVGGLKRAFLALKGVILKVLMSKAIVCLSTYSVWFLVP